MAVHKIEIQAIPPVAFAVPGIRKVKTGDTIIFANQTGGPVRIYAAASDILKRGKTRECVKRPVPQLIKTDQEMECTVEGSKGTYEFAMHYRYKDKTKDNKTRTGFAIGASSPKVIIDR